jgi:hypothetical protein
MNKVIKRFQEHFIHEKRTGNNRHKCRLSYFDSSNREILEQIIPFEFAKHHRPELLT